MNLNFTLILQIISFLILLVFLRKALYRPLMEYLDKRSQEVRTMIESAERDREEAAEHLEHSRKELIKSRQAALAVKNNAVKEADEMIRQARDEAKTEAFGLLEKAKGEIVKETELAKAAIQKDVASIALEIAEKILEREVNDADHRRFIKESLKELHRG